MIPLPRRLSKRVVGALFVTVAFICLALYGLPPPTSSLLSFRQCSTASLDPRPDALGQYPLPSNPHPVEILHHRALARFNQLLSRQSCTAEQAAVEYVRRYGMQPPRGFKEWVEYALANGTPIIDDFDLIMENLAPFRNITSREFMDLMRSTTQGMNPHVESCVLSKGTFIEGCRYFHEALEAVLGEGGQFLPDLTLIMNILDEPSLLVAPEGTMNDPFRWEEKPTRPIAPDVYRACDARGNLTESQVTDWVETHGLPFVQNVDAEKDLCLHREYQTMHGFMMSPASFRTLHARVPLLSRAAPYPFSDVVYPSPHYAFSDNQYPEWYDKPWKRKKNLLYWAGSTTGGYWQAESDSWRKAQRQRFTALAMHKEQYQSFTYLEASGNSFKPYASKKLDTALYNCHITAVHQCDQTSCEEQTAFFEVKGDPPSDKDIYSYRFLFDIDGNAYSGRFYKLLASHSVPLKSTIFREWHDERLVPWLHYIPVSLGMEELPELMRFLATTPEGQAIGSRIAEAGRDWYFRAVTPAHQGIYLYRLLMELAWLQDETRVTEG